MGRDVEEQRSVRSSRSHLALWLLVALLLPGLGGCFSAQYLWQAAEGELELLDRARPLELALQDRSLSRPLRELLAEVPRIKAFGEVQGLRPTANYQAYADLQRPAAVWVVSACQPLAFTSKTWSFPIVGQVPYLGFFDEGEAHDYARQLRAQGLDVDERGSGAFSTLGWFHDPILSTMVSPGEGALGDLAEVVLHESVHATVFLPGEVDLNERLADFVASKLTPLYLEETRGPASSEARAWAASEAWAQSRRARMHEAYLALAEVYASGASTPEKVERKGAILEALRRDLRTSRAINNATLAQFRTYHRPLPELDALFEACGRSVTRLLGAVQSLRSGAAVSLELQRMAREACPASSLPTGRSGRSGR